MEKKSKEEKQIEKMQNKEEKKKKKLQRKEERIQKKEEKKNLKIKLKGMTKEERKQFKLEQKQKRKEQKENGNSVKLREKIALNFRRKWLVNKMRTFLLVLILFLAYIALNLIISTLTLPEIDLTQNKIYSISEESKKVIEKVDQEIKIYTYGIEEETQLIKFLKKYNKINDKITYEILTEATNYEKIQENDLQSGHQVLIFESGEAKKVVDAKTELYTYDYTTGQQIDITEQTITNSILSLLVENKPKVYFTEGHNELSISGELTVLSSYLQNESFEIATINLVSQTAIPDDCDILAIMSPGTDLYDVERDMILNYIAKGGEIYISLDPVQAGIEFPNIKTVLSQFGVSVQNGQIIELATNQSIPSYPNVFKPQVSAISEITKDIYTDQGMWLAYSSRLQFESEETLTALNVEKEDLLTSSAESIFITDLSISLESAIETAEAGVSTIASKITKNITPATEGETTENVQATLIVSATGSYISDYMVQALSETLPLSYIGNNKDFAINCMADLVDKEGLSIRKEVGVTSYVSDTMQKIVVYSIIFVVPAVIILVGIIIWIYRRKRK